MFPDRSEAQWLARPLQPAQPIKHLYPLQQGPLQAVGYPPLQVILFMYYLSRKPMKGNCSSEGFVIILDYMNAGTMNHLSGQEYKARHSRRKKKLRDNSEPFQE